MIGILFKAKAIERKAFIDEVKEIFLIHDFIVKCDK